MTKFFRFHGRDDVASGCLFPTRSAQRMPTRSMLEESTPKVFLLTRCVLAGCVLFGGCGGASSGRPPITESSAGGESSSSASADDRQSVASQFDEDSLDHEQEENVSPTEFSERDTQEGSLEEPSTAQSPWGQTRAEQCRSPERRQMNARAREKFEAGVQYSNSGDYSRARTAFQQALSADSGSYQARYSIGVLAQRSGDEAAAMDHYRQALQIQEDYEPAARGIVTIQLRRGSVREALAFVEPMARTHSTNLHIQALYAEVLVMSRQFDQAWDAARRALRCDERFVPAMVALVKASLEQGRGELAQRILAQALEVGDGNAELHYLKGRMYLEESGRLRDALVEFRRAVQLRPDYAEAHMALGIQLLAGANYPEALSHFETAAQLAPKLAVVHLNLGDAYRANRQWQRAKASLDRALQMNPNLPEAHFNLGLTYLMAGGEFPGNDALTSLQLAVDAFTRYRDMMGPRLPRDDASEGYLRDIGRRIERENRRIERERAAAQQEAERGPRDGSETLEE
ncbi:MAG: tetratricopeptide repeat protein [Myxococcota bacterium]